MSIIINADKSKTRLTRSLSVAHSSMVRNLSKHDTCYKSSSGINRSANDTFSKIYHEPESTTNNSSWRSCCEILDDILSDLGTIIDKHINEEESVFPGGNAKQQSRHLQYAVSHSLVEILARFHDLKSSDQAKFLFDIASFNSLPGLPADISNIRSHLGELFSGINTLADPDCDYISDELLRQIKLEIADARKEIAYLNYQFSVESKILSLQQKVNAESVISNEHNGQHTSKGHVKLKTVPITNPVGSISLPLGKNSLLLGSVL